MRTGPPGQAEYRRRERNREETNPTYQGGTGPGTLYTNQVLSPRQNQGSSALTGKLEEPYNFVTEAKTLAEVYNVRATW